MSLSHTIQEKAKLCVKCGLCLPHCPTYLETHHEGHSPRGRIALMAALAENSLSPHPENLNYLDQCIQCYACEKVCPSHVPYETLFHETYAFLNRQLPVQSHKLPPKHT